MLTLLVKITTAEVVAEDTCVVYRVIPNIISHIGRVGRKCPVVGYRAVYDCWKRNKTTKISK